MGELQKPKAKSKSTVMPTVNVKIEPQSVEVPIEISTVKATASVTAPVTKRELDWGDDDSMSFDSLSKMMTETSTVERKYSPPRPSKPMVQFETEELQFVTDEQLMKAARTFHTSPSKSTEIESKDDHLRLFWFDAYEDPVAQPGQLEINRTSVEH
jgi:hypothetical protein